MDNFYKFEKGLSKEVVSRLSKQKNEPKWMLEYRLKAYDFFVNKEMPKFGPDLSKIDFNDYTYYIKSTKDISYTWNDVPEKIKDTFDKLGIVEAEQKFLSGVSTQFESEVVYHSMLEEMKTKGVVFLDTDTALKKHPELFKKYFNTVVPYTDNKFAALNAAVWSGGSFIYVPKNTKIDLPLQAYFRINSQRMGQFERTLIIVDEGSEVHYVEGCSAPIYDKDSLHAAVVEIILEKNAKCRYSTIQNWSSNIVNLVTKRASVKENALMEWIDGNIGSGINMKYPCCILKEKGAKGVCISIAVASNNQYQDAGAKMIHLAPNTSSTIISKSIVKDGGVANYRGLVKMSKEAQNSRSNVECGTLIFDNLSKSDTIPTNILENDSSILEHEASISKINDEQLFYLMSRGISEEKAKQMIVMGFIEPFTKELPMEYAVELNKLINLEMEGGIG